MESYTLSILLFTLFMLPGLVGVLVPILPGLPYMFIVALFFGFTNKFVNLTGNELGWLAVLAAASLVVDYAAGAFGARLSGASARSLGAGLLGMIVGLFLLPPFGGVIGLFAGVLITELQQGSWQRATKAATGSLMGALAGIVVNFILAVLFVGLFIWFAAR